MRSKHIDQQAKRPADLLSKTSFNIIVDWTCYRVVTTGVPISPELDRSIQYGWWQNYLNTVPNFVRQLANARAKTRHMQYAKMCAAPSAPRTFLGSEGVAFLRAHLPIGARNLARCSNNLATNRIDIHTKLTQQDSRKLAMQKASKTNC